MTDPDGTRPTSDEPTSDEPTSDDPTSDEPTPEQYAARARRADKATRGAMAGILGLEALVVLLVPRAIAFTTGLGTARTVVLVVVAVVLVLAAGMTRRPYGVALGSVMQVVFFATGIFITTMFVVGAIFAVIWLRVCSLRHEVVGTSGGWRMVLE